MRRKIIFHIGTPKTASSALQMFFSLNQEQLKKNGIYYPIFDSSSSVANYKKNPRVRFNGNASVLRQTMMCPKKNFSLQTKFRFNHILRATRKYECVILSEENFFDLATEDFYRNFLNEGIELEVVCFLRRQDKYFESYWGYFVKVYNDFNYKCKDFCESEEINSLYSRNYYQRLSTIASYVGKEHVHVISFDCIENSIYQDFFETLNLPWSAAYEIPSGFVNEKLPFEMIEVKRRLNELGLTETSLLSEALEKIQKKYTFSQKGNFLSLSEQQKILNEFKESNAMLACEFHNGIPLFDEDNFTQPTEWNENFVRHVYQDVLAEYNSLLNASINALNTLKGFPLFCDKVKRTIRKYAVLCKLIDEGYVIQFQRHLEK